MSNIIDLYKKNERLKRILVIIFAGLTNAVALNIFLIPADVFSSGVNGIAQLMSSTLYKVIDIRISTGLLILILNIPIAILGWVRLGKRATVYSFITVVAVTIFSWIVPIMEVTDNPLMNAIMGGVLTGAGVGMTMKYGFSTGGMDIVSLVLAKTTGKSVGSLMLIINSAIITAAGFIFSWESALYTIISIFCLSQVVDKTHTSHQKVTAFIMTSQVDDVVEQLQKELVRGMTLLPAQGAYSKKELSVIMIVVTRYELYQLEQVVYQTDEQAFINVVATQAVYGAFWNEDDQKKYMQSKQIT